MLEYAALYLKVVKDLLSCGLVLYLSLPCEFLLPTYQSLQSGVLQVDLREIPLQLTHLPIQLSQVRPERVFVLVDLGKGGLIEVTLMRELGHGGLLEGPVMDHLVLQGEGGLVGLLTLVELGGHGGLVVFVVLVQSAYVVL